MASVTEVADDGSPTTDRGLRVAKAADARSLDIDRAKGFGIVLVVWGHIASAATLGSPLWFYVSVGAIYTFHMPLFMYLSGFVYFLIAAPERFWRAPGDFTAKRFDRLIVPFLAFGAVAVVGKYLAASIGPIDDNVDSIGDGILRVLTNAPGNPSLSIWYILVLFIYSIATPLLWRLGGGRILPLLVVGAIGWAIPAPEDYYLRRIAIYYIFFVIGGVVALHRGAIFPFIERWYLPLLAAFAVILYLTIDSPYALLICGLACLPGLHGLFRQRFLDRDRVLLTLGRYSMAIYLLNTIALGAAKLVYLHFLPYQGAWFPLYLALMLAIGIGGPMLARLTIGHVPPFRPLRRYLD